MNRHGIMMVDEVAEYLQLPRSVVYRLAREDTIPGQKVGKHWQFKREDVDRYLSVCADDRHHRNQNADPEPAVGRIETFDIDQHEQAVRPWDMRFEQLSNGRFHSRIDYVRTPGMVIYEEQGTQRFEAGGATPEGFILLGTNVASQRSLIDWCGETVDHRRFACSAPGTEVDLAMPNRNHAVVLLVQPEILTRSLSQETVDLLCGNRHLDFSAKNGRRLIATITALVQKYSRNPEPLNDPREAGAVEARLIDTLGGCISDCDPNGKLEPMSFRRASVRRSIEYVKHCMEPITTQELVVAMGVSRRTLEYGFREFCGMSPAEYLRRHRLNCAHHDLAAADHHSATVTKIAMNWGFFHPGRFSSAHYKLFGELPSATLRKARLSPISRFFDRLPAD